MPSFTPHSACRAFAGQWAAASLLLVAGCASDARVSGTVTLDGEPVKGAQVVFARDGSGPVVALTDDAGRYALVGNTGGGLPPGEYRVTVTKGALKDGSVPTGEALTEARAKGLLKNVLPAKYAEPGTTPFRFDLAAGSRAIDLPLTK
jgi:hypothetical protein